jgi:hypothetical protein
MRFGPGPSKTENQGVNRERKAGKREKPSDQKLVLKDIKSSKDIEYNYKNKPRRPGESSRRDGLPNRAHHNETPIWLMGRSPTGI